MLERTEVCDARKLNWPDQFVQKGTVEVELAQAVHA